MALVGGPPTDDLVLGIAAVSVVASMSVSGRYRRRRATHATVSHRPSLYAGSGLLLLLAGQAFALQPVSLQPLSVLGLVGVTMAVWSRLQLRVRDRAHDIMLEATLVALSVGVVFWMFVVQPSADDGRVDAVTSGTHMVRTGLALVVLIGTLRLAELRTHGRAPTVCLLISAALVLVAQATLLADVMGADPPALSAALLVGGVGAAAAATVHPSGRRQNIPGRVSPTRVGPVRILVVIVSVLLVPGLTAIDALTDERLSLVAVAVCSALLSLAVVAYLIALLREWDRLEWRTAHDELTGLPNRRTFHNRLADALVAAHRRDHRVAVMFIDLDRFKLVNDSLGHATGNQLLEAVAKRLVEFAPDGAHVARLQGDEFAVLLAQVDGPDDALAAARLVLAQLGSPYALGRRKLYMTASIGVALHPEDGLEPEALLRSADRAMYRAKELGRNNAQLHTQDMRTTAVGRIDIESALHGAAERGELRLVYQPRVGLSSGKVMGAEALLRWEHPELGPIPPGRFIPIAEETGLIVPVGEWALQAACEQMKKWQDSAFPMLTVSVNLSARQFQLERVADMVARVLRRTGVDPSWLELELTESLALQDIEAVSACLRELAAMGVSCSIDDFGTGYSGLSYLSRFPLSAVKIDKSFVQAIDDAETGGSQASIVLAIIALAKGLDLTVIAEGVETRDQLYFLLRNGCDEMQGDLFSPPVPPERFEELVMLERVAAGPGRLKVVSGGLTS